MEYDYKVSIAITEHKDYLHKKRKAFCKWIARKLHEDKEFLDCAFFTHSAHICLDGTVKRENAYFWRKCDPDPNDDPQKDISKGVTVWYALSQKYLIGPFFITREKNEEQYKDMLRNRFMAELKALEEKGMKKYRGWSEPCNARRCFLCPSMKPRCDSLVMRRDDGKEKTHRLVAVGVGNCGTTHDHHKETMAEFPYYLSVAVPENLIYLYKMRKEFCQWMTRKQKEEPDFLDFAFFANFAYFYVDGTVRREDACFWGESQPDIVTSNEDSDQKGRSERCKARKCESCPVMMECDSLAIGESRPWERRFDHAVVAVGSGNCKTNFVVYCITCTQCKQQYIGSTERHLHKRLGEHKRAIEKRSRNRLALHMRECVSSEWKRVEVGILHIPQGIYRNSEGIFRKPLEDLEYYYINRYSPELNEKKGERGKHIGENGTRAPSIGSMKTLGSSYDSNDPSRIIGTANHS
ncbi:unnamed protein product [Darwinula stevensoni]|uniref:GIY-YIG domain-containing protein n=1 Tax=Darwinula stevensoni TaxID=69355 RepID=A0A7R8X7A0_9CRUS|nr:unnamed protein product [Darwinula stevensoni]CAG0886655.1 unnamed protein product [Darwinula stevensoni]